MSPFVVKARSNLAFAAADTKLPSPLGHQRNLRFPDVPEPRSRLFGGITRSTLRLS